MFIYTFLWTYVSGLSSKCLVSLICIFTNINYFLNLPVFTIMANVMEESVYWTQLLANEMKRDARVAPLNPLTKRPSRTVLLQ